MIYLAKAIKNLRPDSEFSYSNDDYSTIKWIVLNGDVPTQQEVDDEIKSIKISETAEAEAKEAARAAVLEKLGLTADEAAALLG
jgi:hypothetical protein